MISKRMEGLVQNGSAIRAMFEEGARLAREFGAENVFDFSLGNPNIPAPERVREEGVRILRETEPMDLHGYMSNAGYPFVRAAVAESLNRRFGMAFTEDHILMTVGAAGGLNVVLTALLNPGDEVLVFAPYFLEYGNYVANAGGVLRSIPARAEEGFQPSAEALRKALTPKVRALIVNTPNNPTGVVYTKETVKALATVLEEKSVEFGEPIYLISDEPYRELCYDGAEVPWLTNFYKNTVVCYSWSKSLSLPGERIGYLAVSPEAEDGALLMSAAVVANRVLGFVNAPSLQQRLVAACLEERTDIEAYDRNRRALYDGLTELGFRCVFPSGAFYLWVETPGGDDREFSERAKKHNILVVPGSSFACPGYVRIAYCVSHGTILRSMDAFRKLSGEYKLNKKA